MIIYKKMKSKIISWKYMNMVRHVSSEIVTILMNRNVMLKLNWKMAILPSLDTIIIYSYLKKFQIERKDIKWQNYIHHYYQQIF
ncbi:Uncharacterised protein [Mycobacteroides abscessus subsp. abscessus]|nr:Uncharacterised protein [Mycobacteroides abscessus subsp. abscessus]